MKTVRIDNGHYDKVKALSDASGESLTATFNGIVTAGLGELEGLGDALRNQDDAELTFTVKDPERKIGHPVKAELEVQDEEEEEEENQEQGSGTSWLWIAAAVIGILALRHRMQQANIAQQNDSLI